MIYQIMDWICIVLAIIEFGVFVYMWHQKYKHRMKQKISATSMQETEVLKEMNRL